MNRIDPASFKVAKSPPYRPIPQSASIDIFLYMPSQIELRQMRYFLAVAETLHFARAQSKLRIAQPNLSLQIRKIEQALGHALFIRTTRGVKLTAAGAFLA